MGAKPTTKKRPVSPGVAATIALGEDVTVHVRVRDLSGRLLPGARVQLTGLDSEDWCVTDEHALASFDVSVDGHMELVAFYDTTQPGRKTVTFASSPMTLEVAPVDAPPDEAAPAVGPRIVWCTLRVAISYVLTHAFGWQNPALRRKVYFDGQSFSYGVISNNHPTDDPDRDRALRLAGAISYFRETEKLKLGAALEADLAAVEKRDEAEIVAAQKVRKDLGVKGTGFVNTPETQARIDAEVKRVQAEHKVTLDALEADASGPHLSTHRGLVECLLDIFDADVPGETPDGEKTAQKIPNWLRYAVLHLTGLRYRPMGVEGGVHLYISPRDVVRGLRARETLVEEHPESEDTEDLKVHEKHLERMRGYVAEYAALFERDPKLARAVGAKAAMGALARKWSASGSAEGKQLAELATKVANQWIALAEKGAGGSGMDAEATLLGEIVDRRYGRTKEPLDDRVWDAVVRSTQLLNDFVEDGWPPFTPERWNTTWRSQAERRTRGALESRLASEKAARDAAMATELDALPATPKKRRDEVKKKFKAEDDKAAGELEALAETEQSNADGVLAEYGLVATPEGWAAHFDRTKQPYFNQLVCNQVSFILAKLRGATLDPGIPGVVDTLGGAVVDGGPTGKVLFRPTSTSQLEVGDVLVLTFWMPYPDRTKPPSKRGMDVPAWFARGFYEMTEVSGPDDPRLTQFGIETFDVPVKPPAKAPPGAPPAPTTKKFQRVLFKEGDDVQVLTYAHIATVVSWTDKTIAFYETAGPMGFKTRKLSKSMNADPQKRDRPWAFARPPVKANNEMDVGIFLERGRILAGLDDG